MKTNYLLALLFAMISTSLLAQDFTDKEKMEGYAQRGEKVHFIFDPIIYKKEPTKVFVTGSFRAWSSDLADKKWQLKKNDKGLWIVEIDNANYNLITPASEFKFRIDEGEWLEVPKKAGNAKNGNLVFMFGAEKPELRAELLKNGNIWANITGTDRPLQPEAYKIITSDGKEIKVACVLPNTSTYTLLSPKTQLDPNKVYYLELVGTKLKAWCSYDGWFKNTYSYKELGANIIEDGKVTVFRVFSPRANKIKLYLYKNSNSNEAYQTIDMNKDNDGVWEAFVNENLKGTYYDFTVHGNKEAGKPFLRNQSSPYFRPLRPCKHGHLGEIKSLE